MKTKAISLIEVVVSLALVSILILGFYLNHTQQISKTLTLKQYLLASMGLRNIAEKMLANNVGIDYYLKKVKPAVKNCINHDCTPQEIAEFDLKSSYDEMSGHLPKFELTISKTAANSFELNASWHGIGKTNKLKLNISTEP